MKPKTEIRYSIIYNKMFNENFSREDMKKLKEDCKKFEEFYKEHINKVILLIEKHHNKKWKYEFIPIYIVKNVPNSFSDPLTLKYFKNEKIMFIILAHELLHNNFVGKYKFENSEELHKYMQPILDRIIEELDLGVEKELKIFNEKTTNLSRRNS